MSKRALKIVLYNLFIFIFLLTVIELATRTISWFRGTHFILGLHELDPTDREMKDLYQFHPSTGFIFSPDNKFMAGSPAQSKRSRVMTDRYGFLAGDNGLTYAKGPGEIRIAAIGGSTTANINLDYEENWPGRLGLLLEQKFPDKTFRVINAGIPGFDTSQSIPNLALRVMPFNPDIVIVYHAYNDFKAVGKPTDFKPDYSHIHPLPYGAYEDPGFLEKFLNKSMFYVRIRNIKREDVQNEETLQRMTNTDRPPSIPEFQQKIFRDHMRTMVSIAKAGGAKVVLSYFASLHDPTLDYSDPNIVGTLSKFHYMNLGGLLYFTPNLTLEAIFEGFQNYNLEIENIAAEQNCIFVDNARRIPHDSDLFVDRVHFSAKGADLMAMNFSSLIAELVQNDPDLMNRKRNQQP